VGPGAGLDAVAGRKKFCWESNPGHPALSLVTILSELPAHTWEQGGHKREEVTGGWRKHEELHNLYSSGNIIRVTKLRRITVHMGGMRDSYSIFSWKT
jgi:hypothetical protein